MVEEKSKFRFLPYKTDYETLNKWRFWGRALLFLVCTFSIIVPVMQKVQPSYPLKDLLSFLNFLFIFAFFVVNVVTETFIYPATSRKRRIGFVDNSLGSKFLGEDSKNYFSNDALTFGAYKMVVNCFENCFFTYNISKGMMKFVVSKSSLFCIVFLTTAFVGFKDNSIALPILQIFLSSLFITELIHYLNFLVKLNILLEKFKMFFHDFIGLPPPPTLLQHSILLLLDYETTLAFNKSPLSDSVYLELREKLTKEWNELKNYYDVEKAK